MVAFACVCKRNTWVWHEQSLNCIVVLRALLLCRRLPSVGQRLLLLQKQRTMVIKRRLHYDPKQQFMEKTYFTLLAGPSNIFISGGIFANGHYLFIWLRKLFCNHIDGGNTDWFAISLFRPVCGCFVDSTAVKRNDWCGFDNCRRWRSGAGGVLHGMPVWSIMVVLLIEVRELLFILQHSAQQHLWFIKRGTYKMRWFYADHASSKCDYQSMPQRFYILFGLLMQLYC